MKQLYPTLSEKKLPKASTIKKILDFSKSIKSIDSKNISRFVISVN